MKTPIVGTKIKEKIREQVYNAFGGRLYEVIVGGAALNQEVEQFLKDIHFPITVGYGATECAPIITYADWKEHKAGSCGREVIHMEVKIDSKHPHREPGEILTRGMNVMLGYYKNEEATAQAIDKDGWYHTGDLGIIDKKGNVFIKGRSKNMLLGPSGQNIFPEEIEDALNSLPLVNESIVVQREGKLVALVHPDIEACTTQGMSSEDVENLMKQNLQQLNNSQPAYCKISHIEIHDEEFEKTPKKSIKRFLYN
jgi:long-chain acyl-CoA synthetase